ncbi:MAG: hypothetical protein GXP55_12720 [Deltaproteobacteria bacterium]|nr:hypothetical protein [Deltaproteobacteria bacterium]
MSEIGSPEGVKLSVGEVLSTTARAIGARIGPFVLVAALGATPGSILMQIMSHFMQTKMVGIVDASSAGNPDAMMDVFSGMLVLYLGLMGALVLHMLLSYAAQTVLIRGTLDWISGRKTDTSELIRRALPRVPSVLGVVFLRGLAQFGVMMPGMIVGMVMMVGVGGLAGLSSGGEHAGQGAAVGVLGMLCAMPVMLLLMLVPMVYLVILLFTAEATVVAETVGPIRAISRSASMSRGNRLAIFLLILAAGSAFVVLTCGLGMFAGIANLATGGMDAATGMARAPSVFASVLGALINIVMYTVQALVFAPMASVIYARLAGLSARVDAAEVAEVFA